jgi:hypothetical protein
MGREELWAASVAGLAAVIMLDLPSPRRACTAILSICLDAGGLSHPSAK